MLPLLQRWERLDQQLCGCSVGRLKLTSSSDNYLTQYTHTGLTSWRDSWASVHASAFRTMEALHDVRESHKRPVEELPPCDKMWSASAKTKKGAVNQRRRGGNQEVFYFWIASKVKKKPILFSCEEFLHDHLYWDKKQIQDKVKNKFSNLRNSMPQQHLPRFVTEFTTFCETL